MAGSATFGGTIKLQGESEYRKAISQINSDLKVLGSELGKVTAEFGKNDKSVEGLTSRNKVLSDQIEAQKSKVATLKGALQEASEKYGENDKRTQAWQVSLNKAEAELIKMEKELGKNNSELSKYGDLSTKTAESVNKLDKGISGLKGDLDGIDAKYKNNKNSVEALGEKQNILTSILEKQGEKVKTLKDAMDTSKKAYGENSDETKKWEAALNSAEKELTDTEKELKNVDAQMQNASKSTSTFGDMLKASLTAEAITAGIKKLGEGLKSVGNYMMDAIKDASEYGKEISLMSEKTGISTETLQKFKAATKTTGVDVEQFTSTLAKSIKSMNSATDANKGTGAAYAALGVSVRDSNGQLRDAEIVYWEIVDALKNMENETQRDAYAMQIFGKSAQELNPIIKRGSEGFKELTDGMITFDDQTMESLRGLDISMQKFSGTMDGIKRVIGVAFAPAMKELADAAANAGSKFRGLFTAILQGADEAEIKQKMNDFKDSIVKLFEKVPEFLKIGWQILSTIGEGIMMALGSLYESHIKPIIDNILSLLAQWGPLIAAGILVLAVTLGPAIMGLAAILGPIITAGFAVIGTWISAGLAFLTSVITMWPVMLGLVIAGLLVAFWPQISKFFADLWTGICEWLGKLWADISAFLENHWQDLLLWIFAWPAALIKTLIDFWPQISVWLSGLWENIKSWASNTWNNIVQWFIDLKDNMVNKAKDMLTATVDWFKKLPGDIWNAIVGAVQKVVEWGSNLVSKGKEAAQNLWNSIVDKVKSIPGEMLSIGKNLVQGLWDGISNMTQWIKDKIFGFAKGITDSIKNFFGIHSPSTLFKNDIGKNLALGLGEGFSDEMNAVAQEMQNAIPTSFELEPVVNGEYSYANAVENPQVSMLNNSDYMIVAFQKALSGMAFIVDGDKFGEMAVSKVEKVVFA